MESEAVAAIIRDSMFVALKLSGPVLVAALAVGLVISFIQAITQINEATLAFLPKVAAIGAVFLLLGSFMAQTLTSFSHEVFDRIVTIGGL